jgi:aerobic-type carbon monoxide dehydrogenase small subunit (CoxS/CutS family)
MVTLSINDMDYHLDAEPDELLVWVIHEKAGLTKIHLVNPSIC